MKRRNFFGAMAAFCLAPLGAMKGQTYKRGFVEVPKKHAKTPSGDLPNTPAKLRPHVGKYGKDKGELHPRSQGIIDGITNMLRGAEPDDVRYSMRAGAEQTVHFATPEQSEMWVFEHNGTYTVTVTVRGGPLDTVHPRHRKYL